MVEQFPRLDVREEKFPGKRSRDRKVGPEGSKVKKNAYSLSRVSVDKLERLQQRIFYCIVSNCQVQKLVSYVIDGGGNKLERLSAITIFLIYWHSIVNVK